MAQPSDDAAPGRPPVPAIEWRVQPLVERPARGLLALAAIAALAVATALAAAEATWGLLAALILAVALCRAFLPSRYAIDRGGIVVDHPLRQRRVPWGRIERIAFDASGALLTGPGSRWSIDLPRDAALAARAVEVLRAHAPEGCEIVDRRTTAGGDRAAAEARS